MKTIIEYLVWNYKKNGEYKGGRGYYDHKAKTIIIIINVFYISEKYLKNLNMVILHELCHWGNNDADKNNLIDINKDETRRLLEELLNVS